MPPITLTVKAAHWINELLISRGDCLGIRFGVTSAGCGGYKYTVDYVDSVTGADLIFQQHGIKFFIHRDHLDILSGMHVVFRTDGLDRKLEFINPNSSGTCGCGESFST
mgnify:CR=1 FL=1